MANPTAIIPQLEGFVGSVFKIGTDTVNNVTQAANRWCEAVKKEIRALSPASTVFLEGINLSAAGDSLNVSTNALTTSRPLGCVFRNNDTGTRWFRLWDQNTTFTALTSPWHLFTLPVVARLAANSPSYGFVAFPGGLDLSLEIGNGSSAPFSVGATTTPSLGTSATDATMWVVYQG